MTKGTEEYRIFVYLGELSKYKYELSFLNYPSNDFYSMYRYSSDGIYETKLTLTGNISDNSINSHKQILSKTTCLLGLCPLHQQTG